MAGIQGSCLCGGVRFEVTEPFTRRLAVPLRVLQADRRRVRHGERAGADRGDPDPSRARSFFARYTPPEGGGAKTFCSVCGSNLFGGGWPDVRDSASVRLSAVRARTSTGSPRRTRSSSSVAAWEILPDDGLPRYEIRVDGRGPAVRSRQRARTPARPQCPRRSSPACAFR